MTETMAAEWEVEWISKHLHLASIPKDESACLATAKGIMGVLGWSRSNKHNGPAQSVLLDILRRTEQGQGHDIQWTLGLALLSKAIVIDLWKIDCASASHVFLIMCLYIVPRSEYWTTWALILSSPSEGSDTPRELLAQHPNLALEVSRSQLYRQYQMGSCSFDIDVEFVSRMMLAADDEKTKIGYVRDSLALASFVPSDARRLYMARHERKFPDLMKDCQVDLGTLLVIHMLLDAELGDGSAWQRFLQRYTRALPGYEFVALLKSRLDISRDAGLSSSLLISICKSTADRDPFLGRGRDEFVSKVATFRQQLLSILFESIHSRDVGGVVAAYL